MLFLCGTKSGASLPRRRKQIRNLFPFCQPWPGAASPIVSRLYVHRIFRCFWFDFFWSAILTAISSVLQFASPLLVNQLIGYLSLATILFKLPFRFVESSEPLWKGYFYTVLIIIATVATTVINNQYAFKQWMIGLQVGNILILILKLLTMVYFAHCPTSHVMSTIKALYAFDYPPCQA